MPPKRNIKNSSVNKAKPPTLPKSVNNVDIKESTDTELRFDQEVLWCISQFEQILSTGKLPDSKSMFLCLDKAYILII